MDIVVEWKATWNLLYMVTFLLIYIHVQACVFWWVIEVDKGTKYEWVPQTDYMYGETMLYAEDQFLKQYFSMLYHAIMIFGLNEVGPTKTTTLSLVITMMIVASIINAIIFGEIAVLVQELDKKDIELQNTLDNANTAMRNL